MVSSFTRGRVLCPGAAHRDWYDEWCARVPGWVHELVGNAPVEVLRTRPVPVAICRRREHALLASAVPGARHADDRAFEDAVRHAYTSVLGTAATSGLHPLRFWNLIPGLLEPAAADLNRYMVFNRGRAAGYEAVYAREQLPAAIATASGVGTSGGALFVGCLASTTPGIGVENPRQVPAYRYSSRFGPRSPSFARGTIMTGEQLLIGGTAAVRGEDSVAVGDFPGQLAETVLNLAGLIEHAAAVAGRLLPRHPLACLTTARVYVLQHDDELRAREGLMAAGVSCPIETAVATLCRPELLIEVEGTATLRIEN